MEEHTLIVAKATIHGDVTIEPKAPSEVTLPADETFHVRLQYRLAEGSRQHEDYHFRLRCGIENTDAPDVMRSKEDQPGLDDEEWGFLQQTLGPLGPGTYRLHYGVDVEYRTKPWDGADDKETVQAETWDGTVTLKVG